jgi:hypothetical protein
LPRAKLFSFVVGSNREQGQPDQWVALIRAFNAEKKDSDMNDRKWSLSREHDGHLYPGHPGLVPTSPCSAT